MQWCVLAKPMQSPFQPFIRQASEQILGYYTALPIATAQIKQAVINMSNIDTLFAGLFIVAISFGIAHQIWQVCALLSLVHRSYQIRKIGNINILLNETTQTPLCFSLIKRSYIILPEQILENNNYYKIAIAHELQHIRQKDTRWLYVLLLLKVFCFINPCVWLWAHWFNELQEFACDEAVMRRKKTSAVIYGECLLDTAKRVLAYKHGYHALSLFGFKKTKKQSHLYRRVNMLFQHCKQAHKSLFAIFAGILLIISSISTAYALNGNDTSVLSLSQLQTIVNKMNAAPNAIPVSVTPEVLAQINAICVDTKAKQYMTSALKRLAQYKPIIQKQLQARNLPNDLLALPLTESGYQNLDASKNMVSAAGIWQVVPTTAHRYGLVINDARDDRLNPTIETKAALNYLQKLHAQFNDWNLALIAYEIGEAGTQQLINQAGSRNSWDLVRSRYASEDLKKYLPALSASLIIMHNPALLNG
jgi:beta-lactamase regulating signal transducer with metallopeptidase domain